MIYNRQKLETIQMSINVRMDKQNVVYIHMEYYSAIKRNDICYNMDLSLKTLDCMIPLI